MQRGSTRTRAGRSARGRGGTRRRGARIRAASARPLAGRPSTAPIRSTMRAKRTGSSQTCGSVLPDSSPTPADERLPLQHVERRCRGRRARRRRPRAGSRARGRRRTSRSGSPPLPSESARCRAARHLTASGCARGRSGRRSAPPPRRPGRTRRPPSVRCEDVLEPQPARSGRKAQVRERFSPRSRGR